MSNLVSDGIVTLKKGEGRALKSGGAWVYDNEVADVSGNFKNGDIIELHDFDGYFMGYGFINDNSKIPLISKFSTHYHNATGLDKKLLDIQLYADDLYRLIYMTKYKEIIPNEFERQIVVK